MKKCNVIIIGSGISALQLAKSLRCDLNVIILTKSNVYNSNSFFAQGGVAAAVGKMDHPDKHYLDTLEAGRFHNDPEAVKKITEEGPALINGLIAEGCSFDIGTDGELLLGMEGAHSDHRIVHSGGDATGRNLIQFMTANVNQNITIMENVFVFDLLMDDAGERCIGVKGKYPDGRTEVFFGEHIVLATGGCGRLFAYTSNADTVTGDGIALAYRAGAEITDMEFIQFHPTLLHINGKAVGLISEAVRGEGGRLVTKAGKSIMESIHPLSDLAPRHIVSQTIYHYLENGEPVFLDISSVKGFEERFPTITALCEEHGINIKEGLLPIVPGSHFLMGGIITDLLGRSSLEGLYAIGEAACSGIHGANRLASNSLLEGLFIGKKLAEWINTSPVLHSVSLKSYGQSSIPMSITKQLPSQASIQKLMMENVGIMRTKDGLSRQKEWLESFHINKQLDGNIDNLSIEEIEMIFMLITAWLVTDSALKRTESRGGHFRQDYPCENDRDWLRKQIIHRRKTEKDDKHEQIKAALAT
ncbi:L-aspartate oxidase [Bacillus sp. DTU_2020_1000418_1_SI_GHA_SEK_038]|uniref:L-aspartate oxidase n=1 Tax=Bacillus sp. DTU_2020_1000418_1_SI_GHA_SEK_038 TaxID=3077585 RepID=UPI0028EEB022|nr:L-aspartate oxidase [Bacillus sp. DTU_2020_1000418_1_SI_GHA_SEK_038]WNS74440.1 L-aspartate oxidase [Bacillus sp. DTU_2020_1000418_1_SI_GHA_SEK_038]